MAEQPGLTVERKFDRLPQFDERSRAFGIMEAVREPKKLHNRLWTPPKLRINQQNEGACVGHGLVNEASTTPVAVDFSRVKNAPLKDAQAMAFWLYYEAQKIDAFPDGTDGTSVIAGIKVMKRLGLLKEYRWGFSVEQVRTGILTTGPVVIGSDWYSGMYSAPGGILRLTGRIVGGHCYLVIGYRLIGAIFDDEAAYLVLNSWGPEWGKDGMAWIRESDLRRLLEQDGEACIPYRRSYGR